MQRGVTEIEVRQMYETVTSIHQDDFAGRWRLESTIRGKNWIMIVEPDVPDELIVVVTIYSE